MLTTYFYCLLLSVVWRNFCFRGWKKSHQQNTTRKRMFACSIHFHAGWMWKSNVKRKKSVLTLLVEIERVRVFSLEVTLERVCWPCNWKCEKRKSVRRRSIYRKYVSWSRLQKRGTKLKCGRSFEHWPRGSPGQWVPETEGLCASAIFVSGTSGITSILNYRSVSPIDLINTGIRDRQLSIGYRYMEIRLNL